MYADLGPGLEAEIDPPSRGGSSIFYSHEYVGNRMRQSDAYRPTESGSMDQRDRPERDGGGRPFTRSRTHGSVRRRFKQIGRAGFQGSDLNLYCYTGCNPTTATDPSGLWYAYAVGPHRVPGPAGQVCFEVWVHFVTNEWFIGKIDNVVATKTMCVCPRGAAKFFLLLSDYSQALVVKLNSEAYYEAISDAKDVLVWTEELLLIEGLFRWGEVP